LLLANDQFTAATCILFFRYEKGRPFTLLVSVIQFSVKTTNILNYSEYQLLNTKIFTIRFLASMH